MTHAIYSRYATPNSFTVSNATPPARSSAAVPVIAAARCGTMPSVQPAAAIRLARAPRDKPAAIVNSAPVPGVATMTSDVNKKATLISGSPPPTNRTLQATVPTWPADRSACDTPCDLRAASQMGHVS